MFCDFGTFDIGDPLRSPQDTQVELFSSQASFYLWSESATCEPSAVADLGLHS